MWKKGRKIYLLDFNGYGIQNFSKFNHKIVREHSKIKFLTQSIFGHIKCINKNSKIVVWIITWNLIPAISIYDL